MITRFSEAYIRQVRDALDLITGLHFSIYLLFEGEADTSFSFILRSLRTEMRRRIVCVSYKGEFFIHDEGITEKIELACIPTPHEVAVNIAKIIRRHL